ncbi:MAG: S24 family peptidase [Nitrospiraceae bacterium]
MELRSLIHKELSDGLDEEELGASIGVSHEIIKQILAGGHPEGLETWKKFAAYFRMDLDFLRFGKSRLATSHSELLSPNPVTETVKYHKVPVLSWSKLGQLMRPRGGSIKKLAHALIETDMSGPHVFALRVKNDAMEPLFHKGEMIFVNPDLPPVQGHYVVVLARDKDAEEARLRHLEKHRNRLWLRALNPKYTDCLLTRRHRIIGRVVRLRMNL